jgi:hypothetical protein
MNGNDLVILLLASSSIGLFATTIGFAVAWVRARERLLRSRVEPPRPADVTLANADRLEEAIGAMALEVERIGEHQRFVTKLLAQRGEVEPAKATPPKVPGVRSPVPPSS